ncbi:hypothetical protein BO83DRAFT_456535, partial [Aspergillus eucalypticola CBS 122712]
MAVAISSFIFATIKEFNSRILDGLGPFDHKVPVSLWKDEIGRLRIWADDVGAQRDGYLSLDYRLRDSLHLSNQVFQLLMRLRRGHRDIQKILVNVALSQDLTDPGEGNLANLESIYYSVHNIVDCLYQLSIAIRHPARHDYILGIQVSDIVELELFDQEQVLSRYPEAQRQIANQLGRAISLRRVILRGRKRHHEELAMNMYRALYSEPDTAFTHFRQISLLHFGPEMSSDGLNYSYAAILERWDHEKALAFFPSHSAHTEPAKCPYCSFIITTSSERDWAQHVLDDIMPYVCVFPDCPSSLRLYENRQVWFEHVQRHFTLFGAIGELKCPLCMLSMKTETEWESHVSEHLETLALIALRPHPIEVNKQAFMGNQVYAGYGADAGAFDQGIGASILGHGEGSSDSTKGKRKMQARDQDFEEWPISGADQLPGFVDCMYLPTLTRTTPYNKQAVATRGRDLRTYVLSKESDHSWHDFDLDESWGYDGQGFECADSFLSS